MVRYFPPQSGGRSIKSSTNYPPEGVGQNTPPPPAESIMLYEDNISMEYEDFIIMDYEQ